MTRVIANRRAVAQPMSPARAKVAFTVRRFETGDAPAVCRIWKAGFLDMVSDLTYHLGAVGSPEWSVTWPRPVLALAVAAGTARGVVALLRRESSPRARNALAVAGLGVTGLAALHFVTYRAIRSLCDHDIQAGDMRDIPASWQREGESEFFVAVDQEAGTVLGCVAVKKGGWKEQFHKHSTAAAPTSVEVPTVCSVWKVSTAASARGMGVAKALMAKAEDWARSQGGQQMVLVTASPGAKAFYARLGYNLDGGSARGAQFSSWAKTLKA